MNLLNIKIPGFSLGACSHADFRLLLQALLYSPREQQAWLCMLSNFPLSVSTSCLGSDNRDSASIVAKA